MSELSMHELEAQHGEVLPEREALSTIVLGSHNHVTQVNNHVNNHVTSHVTTVSANQSASSTSAVTNSVLSSSSSSNHQAIVVNG